MAVTDEDHEGGGWVRIYQVKDKKWVPVTIVTGDGVVGVG